METLLQDIEKLLAKMNRELATRADVEAVGRNMRFFYQGMLAGAVFGLVLAVVVVLIAMMMKA